MLLSVVVVNWNSKDDLAACLASLEAQTHKDLEVIVVDNGSEDGSIDMVKQRYPQFTLREEGENLGFAEGCNRGIAASRGAWVALLNNDAVADATWAERLVAAANRATASTGMLQCMMLFLDRPDTINSLGLFLTRSGGAIDRYEGEPRRQAHEEEIFCPTGGACAYRRSMLEAIKLPVGYFDREYFMYSEDFDLGWRARLAGWSAWLVPDSVVRHKFHGSTVRRGKAWFVRMTRTNRIRTLLKNASLSFLLRTAHYSAYEIAELFWHVGPKAGVDLSRALYESLRQRARAKPLVLVSRGAVERAWIDARDARAGSAL
jgi:hypothetical protein